MMIQRKDNKAYLALASHWIELLLAKRIRTFDGKMFEYISTEHS